MSPELIPDWKIWAVYDSYPLGSVRVFGRHPIYGDHEARTDGPGTCLESVMQQFIDYAATLSRFFLPLTSGLYDA